MRRLLAVLLVPLAVLTGCGLLGDPARQPPGEPVAGAEVLLFIDGVPGPPATAVLSDAEDVRRFVARAERAGGSPSTAAAVAGTTAPGRTVHGVVDVTGCAKAARPRLRETSGGTVVWYEDLADLGDCDAATHALIVFSVPAGYVVRLR